MADKLSMKLSDILSREDKDPPVDPKTLPIEQRAVLNAYGRACSVRYIGQEVTVKLVEEYAQEDWGYGTVARSKVQTILQELEALGWTFDLAEEKRKTKQQSRKRYVRESATATTGGERSPPPKEPRTRRERIVPETRAEQSSGKAEPKKQRAKVPVKGTVPRLRYSSDDPLVHELVGDEVELKTLVLRAPKPRSKRG